MTRQKMVAFKRLKTMENYKTIKPKSFCKCLYETCSLCEVLILLRALGKIFCVLDRWSPYGRGHLLEVIAYGVQTELETITMFILHEKFLKFDWLRAVVFQLNLKHIHVKIPTFCG